MLNGNWILNSICQQYVNVRYVYGCYALHVTNTISVVMAILPVNMVFSFVLEENR